MLVCSQSGNTPPPSGGLFHRSKSTGKIPTLEGHPAYVPPPRAIPIGQSFRYKKEYRGRYRSADRNASPRESGRWLTVQAARVRKRWAKSADRSVDHSIVKLNDEADDPFAEVRSPLFPHAPASAPPTYQRPRPLHKPRPLSLSLSLLSLSLSPALSLLVPSD